MQLDSVAQEFHVNDPLGIGGKNDLTSVATLRDMMRNINSHHTG
jgi:hypothetical protein